MSVVQTEVPPLCMGDRLSLEEFLLRWEAMPKLKRAELIGGIVYMPSPVSRDHGDSDTDVSTWLGTYRANTPGTMAGSNATTILAGESPQPDDHLRLIPEAGGRTYLHDNLIHGAPELVAEVCATSAAYDLNQKKDTYEEHEVYEYLAILMYEQEIRWHRLVDGKFEIMPPEKDGFWRSQFFPGLWLDGKALLAGDLAKVLAVLQQGLDSPEHGEFVNELQKRMGN